PGPFSKRHILKHGAITPDNTMCRHPYALQTGETGMRSAIQHTAKQRINSAMLRLSGKLTGRQANIVEHQQADVFTSRALITMRAVTLCYYRKGGRHQKFCLCRA